jgi:hypothetical protein
VTEEKRATDAPTFFDTLRGTLLTSIPALSALVFVIVAVKVFRSSMMETTTTVAIVSTANAVDLLKGVILTLLPGFLAGLVAISIWWWGGVLPRSYDEPGSSDEIRRALFSPQAAFAWAMVVTAFFTIWWPVFLILLVPVLASTAALGARWARGPAAGEVERRRLAWELVLPPLVITTVLVVLLVATGLEWPAFFILLVPLVVLSAALVFGWSRRQPALRLRAALRVFGLVAAAVFVGILALEPSVWLPLRKVTFVGPTPVLKRKPLPRNVAAYVLSSDDKSISLLLDKPRAVVQVDPRRVSNSMPLCVPPESSGRILTLRASQVLGIDPDPHSPYGTCPGIKKKKL